MIAHEMRRAEVLEAAEEARGWIETGTGALQQRDPEEPPADQSRIGYPMACEQGAALQEAKRVIVHHASCFLQCTVAGHLRAGNACRGLADLTKAGK